MEMRAARGGGGFFKAACYLVLMVNGSTPLDGERYVNLETFKKDGGGVKTPVWAAALDGKLFVMTDGTSFKVKRLGRNAEVRIAGSDMSGKVHGPWYSGTGRIIEDEGLKGRAAEALGRKYGWQWSVLGFFSRLGGRVARRAYLEISIGAQVA